MSTIIKARSGSGSTSRVAYNLGDISQQAERYLEEARAEADQIVKKAHESADAVRATAEQTGKEAALAAMKEAIGEEMRTLMPALDLVIEDLGRAKQGWLANWEKQAIHLATAIAGKILRRELEQTPEVTLPLVREALELAEGSTHLRILLSPKDMETLGEQVEQLATSISRVGPTEIVADPTLTPGGCRVETQRGVIDNSFEAQLDRIEEELS